MLLWPRCNRYLPTREHTCTHIRRIFEPPPSLERHEGHLCLAAIISPTAVVIRLNNKNIAGYTVGHLTREGGRKEGKEETRFDSNLVRYS